MAEADPFPANQNAAQAAREHQSETRRKRVRLALMTVVPILIVGAGLWYWFGSPGEVETDNAYIKQDIVSVAGEVNGLIVAVSVRENQQVKAGDVLFTIDPSSFKVAMQQADAQIANAQARVTALQADVGANAADLAGARDELSLAQANYSREKALMERGFNTRARMDAANFAVASARDKLNALDAEVAKAQAQLATGAQVPGVNPAIAAAQATRAKAVLDLQRTVIRAPASGRVTQVNRLQIGQMVFAGVPMLSVVRDDGARVEANFKETDLDRMRAGQPAEIRLDAYPGLRLKGHVDSIGAGTGSEFSVLPAQNATGNWVKVIQRVPVRIAIDEKTDRPLIAGLSAAVSVHVGKH
ncbi:HlyD family secretion protein [Novosphingobium sp. KCTC 2891]|uniref:HlyD family secretion protein n=1 Tax=Novosphingobium sp. KCTC 2891 TaxID=2989730 RepID=UPI0022228CC3|nr:HlyD family secretion protein [Novosphingobium sp. KCTC 2891]MCW1383101.1 HlyD family secretion protein [Novosphingobium sp. KCTC 2891]